MEGGYHGITDAIAAFTPSSNRKAPLAPHIRTFPAPDVYRGAGKGLKTAEEFAALLDGPIEELEQSQYGFAGTMIDRFLVFSFCLFFLSGF